MSADDKTTSVVDLCASCGIAGVDDTKLKNCACNLVKYCSVDCQKNHRPQHKRACRKRLAELHDDDLFKQPDSSHFGECSICCLPLSLDPEKSTLMGCCCKLICNGCERANTKHEREQGLQHRCAFCREPAPTSEEEYNKRIMKRIKKKDPVAMTAMGKQHEKEEEYGKAAEYYTKAAELGDANAHFLLGALYYEGNGVEKDEKKMVFHWEQGAIGGHPQARCLLATHDRSNGRLKRAAKHLIISANLGCEESLQQVQGLFVVGIVSKDEYAAALREYQAALNETKSPERDEAQAFYARN